MLDLLLRFLQHPLDYLPILQTTNLSFIDFIKEDTDYYSFNFRANNLPNWKAGQHAIFTMPQQKITGQTWRVFSVASASYEDMIKIGTIIPEPHSDFKDHLLHLKSGVQIKMHGPFGEMYVRPYMKNIVAIAGGIGITPFRSIMADLTQKKSDTKFTLIFAASENKYIYKSELETWKQINPNLDIIYTDLPTETNAALDKILSTDNSDKYFFISGSPGMIVAMRRELRSRRIATSQIFNDSFNGY